jgi:hypothetical protein
MLWVLDDASDQLHAFVMELIPAPFRLLHRFVWEPRSRRLTAVVRA